jgi:hypothetical protein
LVRVFPCGLIEIGWLACHLLQPHVEDRAQNQLLGHKAMVEGARCKQRGKHGFGDRFAGRVPVVGVQDRRLAEPRLVYLQAEPDNFACDGSAR